VICRRSLAEKRAANRGALGDFFAHGIIFRGQKRSSLKSGDTPSFSWLLTGNPRVAIPAGVGRSIVRAWTRPYVQFGRITTAADRMEHLGILELVLPLGNRRAPRRRRRW